jgi:flagellar FliL protein
MANKQAEAPANGDAPDRPEGKQGKKKLLIPVLVLVLVSAGAYVLLARGGGPAAAPPPEPGQVLKLDPITMNLAEGRFLKLGLALQFTTDAADGHGGGSELDGSKALDLAIAQFSNRRITELNSSEARGKAKEQLVKVVEKAYHDTVMDVYFTEFVMQ